MDKLNKNIPQNTNVTHAPVVISLQPHMICRGRGYWKFNNRVLYEKEYLDTINNIIQQISNLEIEANPQDKWEALKIKIIAESQDYCYQRAMNRNLTFPQLEDHIMAMEAVGYANLAESDKDILERTKKDLNEMKNEHIKGVAFRSRATWYNESESCTKYFYNLERAKSGAKNMNSLLLENGEIVVNPRVILKHQQRFYSKLYTKEEVDDFNFINEANIHVPNDIKNSMEGLFTKHEIRQAVKGMRHNKSPGLDGLTTEFYCIFLSKFDDILLKAINYAFTSGKLHNSATRGIISLIPKRGKDIRKIESMRPISLLPTEYKIVEKMMANRIKPALEFIVNEDQKGFLSSHRISCNIRRILDLIEYTQDENVPAMILSIDFLKCFDRIDISALLNSLRYFNIGEEFIRWTSIIYQNSTSSVINNGNFSESFKITRGVKQGGPCSAYFF